jgi:hypothetical protein
MGYLQIMETLHGIKEEIHMKPWRTFQDWSSLVLGAVLFLAPWLFGTAANATSSWNAWILGVIVAGMALFALARPMAATYEGVEAVAGIWLFLAPWILGFAAVGAAAWTGWIIGVLLVALATWKLAQVRRESVHATAF